jgi:hypothetical protein
MCSFPNKEFRKAQEGLAKWRNSIRNKQVINKLPCSNYKAMKVKLPRFSLSTFPESRASPTFKIL